MATYKLTNGNTVIRAADGAFIPMVEDNTDYRNYQVWLAAGNTPAPADPVPVEVHNVRKLTIIERLDVAGKLAAADAALASNTLLRMKWQAAPELIPADYPDVVAFLTAIGADVPAIMAPDV